MPTAIIAVNDQMAVGALTAAHRRGLDVPGDLTIVGFGDTMAARQAWPPLTTVSVPRHEMGSARCAACSISSGGGEPSPAGCWSARWSSEAPADHRRR